LRRLLGSKAFGFPLLGMFGIKAAPFPLGNFTL
jgi:hypothetical protein